MAKIDIINLKGEKVKDIKLNDDVFGIEANQNSVKKMIKLQLDSIRQGTQKAKTRAEVSGGGRKPYRQKGTGNARQGSIRAPHYRKGGVAFAPTPRSYTFKINKKERLLALKSALSIKANEKVIKIIDSLELTSLKTKEAKALMTKLNLSGKILFVINGDAENIYMATRNLNNIAVIMVNELNVYDLIHADYVVMDEASLKHIEEVLK
ncbi:MAG: 50S ribosomal protein L4 [Bacilli bacterium]|nr:50S ribosomal protein L4 [Bacilli bacterium]MDD4406698.1 50S ribosomal protein L4 [Bacilli bacterium]